MPVLPNAKHEAFARGIVEGKSGRDAYRGAGYAPTTDNAADASASRLLAGVKVAARVDELKKDAAGKSTVTAARVLDELGRLGFANMLDYMRVGPDSDPVLDFTQLTRDQAAPLAEVTVEDFLDGRGDDAREVRKVKFKLHDKLGALVALGKHFKLFTEKHELSGKDGAPIQTESVSELELARRIAFALEQAARTTAAARPRRARAKRREG